MKANYRIKWIIINALGIFLSLGIAAVVIYYAQQMLGEPSTVTEKWTNLGFAVVGGILCGSILAFFQMGMLKSRYKELSRMKWWRNTVLGFTTGWVIAILPSLFYNGQGTMGQVIPPFGIPTYTIMFGSIMLGGIFGGLIGWGQYFELRKHRPRSSSWIGMNVFGWAAGFFLMGLLGLVFQEQLSAYLLAGVFGSLLTAICVAVITSAFFQKLNKPVV